MLFVKETVKTEELNTINNFFSEFENEVSEITITEEAFVESPFSKYITTIVSSQYKKSVEDIENTKVGNKRMRKRNLQQVMQESFFSGANRFGNNFIA